ncbi:hypothetical protein C8J56DRAFT_951682 [Mycena floridula]|nr:hypothetical protein C8J56DRAFT_951682 [Mycena floridula]
MDVAGSSLAGFVNYPWSAESNVEAVFLTGPNEISTDYEPQVPSVIADPTTHEMRADLVDLNNHYHELLSENSALGRVIDSQAQQIVAQGEFIEVIRLARDDERRSAEIFRLRRELAQCHAYMDRIGLDMIRLQEVHTTAFRSMAAVSAQGAPRLQQRLWATLDMMDVMDIELHNLRSLLSVQEHRASIVRFLRAVTERKAARATLRTTSAAASGLPRDEDTSDNEE